MSRVECTVLAFSVPCSMPMRIEQSTSTKNVVFFLSFFFFLLSEINLFLSFFFFSSFQRVCFYSFLFIFLIFLFERIQICFFFCFIYLFIYFFYIFFLLSISFFFFSFFFFSLLSPGSLLLVSAIQTIFYVFHNVKPVTVQSFLLEGYSFV